MSWRYAGISLILTIPIIAAVVPGRLAGDVGIFPAWLREPPFTELESRLAMGLPIPLACADASDLELLNGVSDTLAFELIKERRSILLATSRSTPADALQLVHGVGAKTAEKLVRYLDLANICTKSHPYGLWPEE